MLDDTDRAIISLLQYDGRMPFTHIAEQVGITEGGVRRRVKKLTDNGVLQIVGVVEPQELGWNEAGMIAVTVSGRSINAVAEEVALLPEVSYLFQAAGEFDLFVEVYCRDREHFVSFLNDELQRIPGVERTQTFIILKMYKISYRWGEAEPPRLDHRLPVTPENQEQPSA